MADLNKFEQMLEKLVNEDKAGAEELFHEIVVEKSRDIYESLLESDLEDDEVEESTDEEVDEAEDEEVDESEDDAELDEDFNLDEFEVEADPMDAMMGGDETDDMMGDMEMGAGDEEGGEGDVEDRVEDLEDALEELKAEFEAMMAGEAGEEEHGDMDMDMGDEEGEEDEGEEEPEEESFNFEAAEEEVEESKTPKTAGEQMREYVEKVSAKMGDNGANTKSTVAGANNMGGTSGNIVKGGADEKGGKAAGPKEDNAGNVNVPGAKASKSMAAQSKGHGAEKKGAGETADNKKSVVGK